jgi:SAM-dependent methyltransferase
MTRVVVECPRSCFGARSGSAGATCARAGCVKFSSVSLLPDYSRQAEHYDETRAASPSVLRPLCDALEGAPGRRLADIGGGTGNYAHALKHEGWEPVVVDRSPEMLARAAAKGLETVEADAQRLPFDDESFDAAMMLAMLHHVENRGAALAEARRILRAGGRLVLKGFTGEDAATLWILDYFPISRPTHPPTRGVPRGAARGTNHRLRFRRHGGRITGRLVGRSRAGARGGAEGRDELVRADATRPSRRAPSRSCAAARGSRSWPGSKTGRHRQRAELGEAVTTLPVCATYGSDWGVARDAARRPKGLFGQSSGLIA